MKRIISLVVSVFGLSSVIFIGIKRTIFSDMTDLLYYGLVIAFLTFFIITITVIINHQRQLKIKALENRLTAWSSLSYHVKQIGDEAFNELEIGILLYDKNNMQVKWSNPFANKIFNKTLENFTLGQLHEELVLLVNENLSELTISVGDFKYDAKSHSNNQVIYLFDVTSREEIKLRYKNRSMALGILYLDNVEEALQGFDIYERSNIRGEYLGVITDWISEHDGYLKLYMEDRMVIAMHFEELQKIIATKFDILNKVREISTKHHVRVSASIGIASWDVSFDELGALAQNAIELAEKRGGDQVVVNIQNEKIAYFGGKSNASEKSSRVQVRVQSQTFRELIEASKNVFIMGHKQSDIDAFGAMIGVFRMCEASGIPARIVYDPTEVDQTVDKVLPFVEKESKDIFDSLTSPSEVLRLMEEDTLLVVVDTQSPSIVSNAEVLRQARKVAVIDHHRHGDVTFEGVFMYVEPYASSSVELIAEMMEFYQRDINLSPLEASIMYGGIIVDTNDFTYRTGMRTFGAAAYLKEHEASSIRVKEWLRLDLDRTLLINKLLKDILVVTPGYAAVIDTSGTIRDRVLLAQVSSKILEVYGIEAGFTIALVGDGLVGISARSYDSVNVQVIMEEMGGGGHLNSAATQIKHETVQGAFDSLKQILIRDDEDGEKMKVILTEDVKGKGKKDDVIEVANGYGQFLLSNNKAIIASDDNIKEIERLHKEAIERDLQHLALMNKLKAEIEARSVDVFINIGADGKLFGSVTTKQIVESFEEQTGIRIDRKKLELTSEINSVGIYTATVSLHKDVKAQFEINVLEK